MGEETQPKFEVVGGRDFKEREVSIEPSGLGVQRQLFPIPRKGLVLVVSMSRISGVEFEKTLDSARPTDVLDFREYPRFDLGRMNRHAAFAMFDHISAIYFDVHALVESRSRLENEQALALLEAKVLRSKGAVLVLLDDSKKQDKPLVDEVIRALVAKQNLELVEVPPAPSA